MPWEKEN